MTARQKIKRESEVRSEMARWKVGKLRGATAGILAALALFTLALIVAPTAAIAASTTYTYHFVTTSESWTGQGGADTTNTYSSGTGNPAGSLQSRIFGKNKIDATAGWLITGITWETLGVPAGATVTDVDGSYSWQCSEWTTGNTASTSGNLSITDSADGNATTLETGLGISATTTWAARNASAAMAIPAAIQASNSSIKIKLVGNLQTGNNVSGAVTRDVDVVSLTITYTVPTPTLTVGEGDLGASTLYKVRNDTNVAVSDFTMVVSPAADTVNQLVITGAGTTANVSSVKVYRDNNNDNAYDIGDTLVGSGTFSGATATLSSLTESVGTTAQNYIITYDISGSASDDPIGITGQISGVTTSGGATITDSDSTDNTVVVDVNNPSSTISVPVAGAVYNSITGEPVALSGAATDTVGVTGVEISTNGGGSWSPVTTCTGCPGTSVTWDYNWTLPADGSYTVQTRATDRGAHVETPAAGNGVVVDQTAPAVTTTTPTNGATGVALNSNVTINFNDNLDCTTVTTANIVSNSPAAFSSCTGSQAVFTTSGQANNTRYIWNVTTAVKDDTGNPANVSSFYYDTLAASSNHDLGIPVDNSTNTSAPVTDLLMITVPSSDNGPNDEATAAQVTVNAAGGTVVQADVTNVCIRYGTGTPYCDLTLATFPTVSFNLTTNGEIGGSDWTVTISLAASSAGQTFSVRLDSITGTDGANLPFSTAVRSVAAGPSAQFNIIACDGCHTYPPTDGSARNNPAGAVLGNHTSVASHSLASGCAGCHLAPGGTDYSHRNGLINMVANIDGYTNSYYDYGNNGTRDLSFAQTNTTTAGTCKNTYCHGTASPTWGTSGSLNCESCHPARVAAVANTLDARHSAHYNSSTLATTRDATNLSTTTNTRINCGVCHNVNPTNKHVTGSVNGASATDGWTVNVIFNLDNYGSHTGTAAYANGGATSQIASDSGYRYWTNGTCSNNYCHSDGKATPGNFKSPKWTDAVTGSCYVCHEGRATYAGIVNMSGVHKSHIASDQYAFTCDECHARTVADDTINAVSNKLWHVNGFINVAFSATALPLDTVNQQTNGSWSGANCTNLYCHSQGTSTTFPYGGGPNTTPVWATAPGTFVCTDCHNYGTSIATVRHASHVNNSGTIGTNYDCYVCHVKTTVTTNTLNTISYHVNGIKNVNFTGLNPSGTYNTGTKACTSVYCHSTGTATPVYNTPDWDTTAALGCNGCHGVPNDNASGDHVKHATNGASDCYKCHTNTTTNGTSIKASSTSHTNGARNVDIDASVDTNGGTSNWSGTQCSAIYCHGAGTPTWGVDSLNCSSCHQSNNTLLGRHNSHYNTATAPTVWNTGGNNSTQTLTIYGCGVCHYNTNHGGGEVVKTHRTAEVIFNSSFAGSGTSYTGGSANTVDGSFRFTNGTCSVYCHSNGTSTAGGYPTTTVTWASALGSLSCTGCHNYTAATTPMATIRHASHVNNSGTIGTNYDCADCHYQTTQNNTTIGNNLLHSNTIKNVTFAGVLNASAAYNNSTKACTSVYCHSTGTATPVYNTPDWDTTAALGCNGCHGVPNDNAGGDHVKHATNGASDCYKCHTNTTTNGTSIKASSTIHTDGIRNVNIDASVDTNGGTSNWTAGTKVCNNIYCHGAGTPTWGVDSLNCSSCHQSNNTLLGRHNSHYNTATAPTVWNTGGNDSTQTLTIYGCGVCHYNTNHGGNEVVPTHRTAEVIFNSSFAGSGTSYTGGSANTVDGSFKFTNGTCSVYCHSNGTSTAGGYPTTTVTWASALGSLSCTGCHNYTAATTPMASGRHRSHINNATYLGVNNDCADCHYQTTQNNTTIGNNLLHANTIKNVTFAGVQNASAAYNNSTKVCSSVYCHSNGNDTVVYVNPDWDTTGAMGCNGCHGTSTSFGQPDYANGGAGAASANSHQVGEHVTLRGGSASCVSCHRGTTSNGLVIDALGNHVNGIQNVIVNSTWYSPLGSATWTASTKTCANVYCHTTVQGSNGTSNPTDKPVQWGATLNCSGCHADQLTTFTGSHQNHTKWTGLQLHVCANCHNGAGSGTSKHADRTIDIAINAAGPNYTLSGQTFSYSAGGAPQNGFGTCSNTMCHGAASGTWGDAAQQGSDHCTICHGTLTTAGDDTTAENRKSPPLDLNNNNLETDAQVGAHANHVAPSPSYIKDTYIGCKDCHIILPQNGTLDIANHIDETTQVIQAEVIFNSNSRAKGFTNDYSATWTAGTTTCTNVYCHGAYMPKGDTGGADTSPSWTDTNYKNGTKSNDCAKCHAYVPPPTSVGSHSGKLAGSCQSCHPDTISDTNDNINVAGGFHINGKVDAAGGSCTGCHDATTGSSPVRRQVTSTDFTKTSRHVKNTAVKNLDCVVCHAEGNVTSTEASPATLTTQHGGDGGTKTVALRDVDSAGATGIAVQWDRTAITSTMRDGMDTFCMNCHDSDTSSASASRGGSYNIAVDSSTTALLVSAGNARRLTPFNHLDGGSPLDVRGQFNYNNAVGKARASHHNIKQFTLRYTATYQTTYAARGGWTANTSRDGAAMNWVTPLHCSDCHVNETNAHGGVGTVMLRDMSGNDAAATNNGTGTGTFVCYYCHDRAIYNDNATDTAKSRLAHQTFDTVVWGAGTYPDRGIVCNNCHGSGNVGGVGTIHGTNAAVTTFSQGATKAYRFTYGNELHYDISEANWETTTQPACYTQSSTGWGTCNKHDGAPSTARIAAPGYTRALQ